MPRSGNAWHYFREVELDDPRIVAYALARNTEQPLRAVVAFNRLHQRGITAGHPVVVDRLLVDRKVAAGSAVVGCHISHGCAVGGRERGCAFAKVFNERPNDIRAAQQLGDGQHEVRCRHPLAESTAHVHAHDIRGQEIDGLAQHSRHRLDPADAPAEHADAVDHGRV